MTSMNPPEFDRSFGQHGSSPSASSHQKTALICPNCSREAPVDGGWRRESREDGVSGLYCPDCQHLLTVRSLSDRKSSS